MPEEYQNIYKAARRAVGITQERAAELLCVSVRSLADYETGQRIPPGDVVDRMSTIYDNVALGIQHIRETNKLMARVVPELEERSLSEVTLRIYNRMIRFYRERKLDRLMEIAEDGKIDDTERPEHNEIISEMRDIIKSYMELDVFYGRMGGTVYAKDQAVGERPCEGSAGGYTPYYPARDD